MSTETLPTFAPEIFRSDGDLTCSLCSCRPPSGYLLGFKDEPTSVALCEDCCVQSGILWAHHRLAAQAAQRDVSRVVVLVARRRWARGVHGKLLPSELPGSYEFLTVSGELPSLDVSGPEDLRSLESAAISAVQKAGVVTWPCAVVPAYLGYAPDGTLCRFYVARAWADSLERRGPLNASWVPWPLRDGLGPRSRGLGRVLDDVWSSTVASPGEEWPGPSTQVGEAAVRYLALLNIMRNNPGADVSMMPAYQAGMGGEEARVVEVVGRLWLDRVAEEREEGCGGEDAGRSESDAEVEVDGSEGAGGEASLGDDGDDEDALGEGSGELEPGFARP